MFYGHLAVLLFLSLFLPAIPAFSTTTDDGINYEKKEIASFNWADGSLKHKTSEFGLMKNTMICSMLFGVDGEKNLYFQDPGNGIEVFSSDGIFLRSVVIPISFSHGFDLWMDGDGSVYFGDPKKIYRVHADGSKTEYERQKASFVRNGKFYAYENQGKDRRVIFETKDSHELKPNEVIAPDLFYGVDLTEEEKRDKRTLVIKTDKVKDFIKLSKSNLELKNEIRIAIPKKDELYTWFKFIGVDKAGRIVLFVSFQEKHGEVSSSEDFYVYSKTGELVSVIPIDISPIEPVAYDDLNQGVVDGDGNIYWLDCQLDGAKLYKWHPLN